jgi:hypothetical protein
MIEKSRNLVEPAAAAALAAVLDAPGRFAGREVAIVCSGGNISPAQLFVHGDRRGLVSQQRGLNVGRLPPVFLEEPPLSFHRGLPSAVCARRSARSARVMGR